MSNANSKVDTWMPLYIADYLADTSRLTTEQHGAYLLMIMDYWRNGPLPDDDEALANITRLSLAAWKKNRPSLARLFKVADGEWRHSRIERELERSKQLMEQRKNAGKASAAKRAKEREGQQKDNEDSTGVERSLQREGQQSGRPSPSPTPVNQISVERPSPATEPSTRFGQMLLLLCSLEAKRGIELGPIPSTDPCLHAWANAGVTDAEIIEAHGLAAADRAKSDNPLPIKPPFLDVFLAKIRAPASKGSSVVPLVLKAWHETNAEVEKRGKEHGLSWASYLENGKNWACYKADVIYAVEHARQAAETA